MENRLKLWCNKTTESADRKRRKEEKRLQYSKKQCYHLEPPAGLMNDPNGLVWFRGRYYVFFQWNRFQKDHSHKEWGLFTSKDLLHWVFEGGILKPEEPYECNGVYSGSALVIDQRLHLFYTGNDKTGGIRRSSQCLATSTDGQHFAKQGIVLETPAGFTEHFRDPKVLATEQAGYWMVIGAQRKNGHGAVALCHSADGEHWRYEHLLGTTDAEMVECPDLFCVDGQDILLYCPQKRDNAQDVPLEAHTVYKPVTFDCRTGTLADRNLDSGTFLLDDGFDAYAPQTFETPDGRRLLLAWMSRLDEEQERIFAENEPRIHCLTLPRELSWKNGQLYQNPARELYALLEEPVVESYGQTSSGNAALDTRCYCLTLELPEGADAFSIHQGEVDLHWADGIFSFTRQNWAGAPQTKTRTLNQLHRVEVWADTSSVEVFLNGGESVFSARVYPQQNGVALSWEGLPPKHEWKIQKINAEHLIDLGGILS